VGREGQSGVGWTNYHDTYSDALAHTNVDPRFADPSYTKLVSDDASRLASMGFECVVNEIHSEKVLNPLSADMQLSLYMQRKADKKIIKVEGLVESVKALSFSSQSLSFASDFASECQMALDLSYAAVNVPVTFEQLVNQLSSNDPEIFNRYLNSFLTSTAVEPAVSKVYDSGPVDGSFNPLNAHVKLTGLTLLQLSIIYSCNSKIISAILDKGKVDIDAIAIGDSEYGTTAIMHVSWLLA